jgi:hypothetical protein
MHRMKVTANTNTYKDEYLWNLEALVTY